MVAYTSSEGYGHTTTAALLIHHAAPRSNQQQTHEHHQAVLAAARAAQCCCTSSALCKRGDAAALYAVDIAFAAAPQHFLANGPAVHMMLIPALHNAVLL